MRFCQTADWHITTRTVYAKVRLEFLSENVTLLADKGKKNHIDFFVLLGDIFNTINPSEEERFFFATQVKKLIIVAPVYLIPGNHDGNDQISAFSSLGELVNDKRLIIINKRCIIKMYGYKVCFLPYSSNLPKYILKARNKNTGILFSHFSLIGAKVSKENFRLKSWIDSRLLTSFKYVGLGDVHKGQNIDNCYYSGSTNKISFGEIIDDKYFLIVDIDKEIKTKKIYTTDIKLIEYDEKTIHKLDNNEKYVAKIKYKKENKDLMKKLYNDLINRPNVVDVKMEIINNEIIKSEVKKLDYRKTIQEILYDYLKLDKTLKIEQKKDNYKYVKRLWV